MADDRQWRDWPGRVRTKTSCAFIYKLAFRILDKRWLLPLFPWERVVREQVAENPFSQLARPWSGSLSSQKEPKAINFSIRIAIGKYLFANIYKSPPGPTKSNSFFPEILATSIRTFGEPKRSRREMRRNYPFGAYFESIDL
jgi:hypothetical protein